MDIQAWKSPLIYLVVISNILISAYFNILDVVADIYRYYS